MRVLGGKAKDKSVSLSSAIWSCVPPLARIEGAFLESVLPMKAIAHLTTPRQMSEQRLRDFYDSWVRDIQARHRVTIGWVKAIEIRPQRHVHAALVAACMLDCEYVAALWREMVAPRFENAARVEAYLHGLCGLGYILKQLPDPCEEIQFSENLAAFAVKRELSGFRTTAAQRRQQRRIREQIGDHSRDPLHKPNWLGIVLSMKCPIHKVELICYCPACRGEVTSKRKAATSRDNGKLGGRPKGSKNKPKSETKGK